MYGKETARLRSLGDHTDNIREKGNHNKQLSPKGGLYDIPEEKLKDEFRTTQKKIFALRRDVTFKGNLRG